MCFRGSLVKLQSSLDLAKKDYIMLESTRLPDLMNHLVYNPNNPKTYIYIYIYTHTERERETESY